MTKALLLGWLMEIYGRKLLVLSKTQLKIRRTRDSGAVFGKKIKVHRQNLRYEGRIEAHVTMKMISELHGCYTQRSQQHTPSQEVHTILDTSVKGK